MPRPGKSRCAMAPDSPSGPEAQAPARSPAPVPQPAELLAAIIASSEDAIASKTLQGIVTSWNLAAQRLFGFTPEEMIGQPILRIIPPELYPEEERILAEISNGHRIERYETVRLRKDGSRVHISLTVSPILNSAGKVVGAAKVAHDITKLRALVADRELLLESERSARGQAERMSRLK